MDIHDYASRNDISGVRRELAKGTPVDIRDEKDYTPLAYAARSADTDKSILELLIEAGADLNAPVDESKRYPVGLAAGSGDLEKVELLLDAGADINYETPNGYTVLINIMHSLHDDSQLLPMTELLLHHGAETDCESDYGESPLSVASLMGRFEVVKVLLDAGADPSPLQWTELMRAVALGSHSDVQRLLDSGGKLDDRDRWERTPWLLTAFVDDVSKARLLQEFGANIEDRDRRGATALMYSAARGSTEMLSWLIEIGVEIYAIDEFGKTALMCACESGETACVSQLLEAGANPSAQSKYDGKLISLSSNEELIRLLIEAGEDIGDISTDMKRVLTGLKDGELKVTHAEFQKDRTPRFGRSNPDVMEVPFWNEMVRAGIGAYQARSHFRDSSDRSEPVWCFSRFGMSFTELPDGRFVQIGGEHEDFYDPDFYIYNDVVIHERSGKFQIMGYPQEVFPPTDFHSATFVDGFIYIIGGLGYHGARRFGTTPIFRLNCETWKIEPVPSNGQNPGWIYEHIAQKWDAGVLVISGGKICCEIDGEEQHVENKDTFLFDCSSRVWTRT